MGKKPDPDDLYRYLGFEVNPGRIKEFWNSDNEKKAYLNEVQERGGKLSVFDRDTSILNIKLMSSADKIISIIGNFLLIIAFFLPIYSINLGSKSISGSAISFFLNMPFIGSYAAWGSLSMILTVVVVSLILIACPAAGILNLLGLFNKKKGDRYLETVKKFSRFTFIPIVLYLILLFLLLFGGPQPFGSLGVEALGDSLNITALFTLTGIGFWLNIVGLAIAFAQSRGI